MEQAAEEARQDALEKEALIFDLLRLQAEKRRKHGILKSSSTETVQSRRLREWCEDGRGYSSRMCSVAEREVAALAEALRQTELDLTRIIINDR